MLRLRSNWISWAAAGLSAGLIELPFPLAGPLPAWRAAFAWFGLVPLLAAVLSRVTLGSPRPLRRAFLLGYLAGVLWYAGNCYWIYDTMLLHGGLPPVVSALLLLGYSLVLGTYFGLFGLGLVLVARASGSVRLALLAAPVLWTALELAAARITSVPWDQLGYSQVDNSLVNGLAPWTGVYGISFVLVAVNALLAAGLVLDCCPRRRFLDRRLWAAVGAVLMIGLGSGVLVVPSRPAPSATAVLVQPNLDVAADLGWGPDDWNRHLADFERLAGQQCKSYIAGLPQTAAPTGEIVCPPYPTHPDLVVWPEAPAPFFEQDPRLRQALTQIARASHAPVIAGSIGGDIDPSGEFLLNYNSALVVSPEGNRVGRYDKIHLVPFGEYIPFKRIIFFARKLTGRVAEFSRGEDRKVFRLPTASGGAHRYGVFICYEAVFADEVRQFSRLGAEVLVNISDDGWYGDTSAPWQHLNMARMRAIENRRWILRATNNGVTAAIDPNGQVRQSIPRHQADALPAAYGFRDDITFYSEHGDLFAWLCVLLSFGTVVWAVKVSRSVRHG
ncbi:MAG: apolipoprotein N-acyltransferase [Terracidiphilus sp.]